MFKIVPCKKKKTVIVSKYVDASEGGTVAYKINRAVMINGVKTWIRANTEQEYADKLALLFAAPKVREVHNFSDYAKNWFDLYCVPTVEKATVACYRNLLRKHIFPALGAKAIEDIVPDDIQRLYNGMDLTKCTKRKVRIVLNMIFNTALEDNLIVRNPVQSKRIKLTGNESTTTQVYSLEQMRYLTLHVGEVVNETDRRFLALQAFHPMRLEEVLGLKWSDIDFENGAIHIVRAVTHPDRNRPEIKKPKTEGSIRTIGLSEIAARYLVPGDPDEFVIGGPQPVSYHRVTCMCRRIQRDTGFDEKITPKRFRTTVLTDIYEQTKDIKATQAAAGHTTAEMTLEHYVKGRGGISQTVTAVDAVYRG